VKKYDPDKNVDPGAWLAAGEGTRIHVATSYHRHAGVRLPNIRLHAAIHVIVENQLALAEPIVIETLARLQKEGLSRHDAVHAIGSILAKHINELLTQPPSVDHDDANAAYFDEVKRMTAADWIKSG
jgi:hypothetical protein